MAIDTWHKIWIAYDKHATMRKLFTAIYRSSTQTQKLRGSLSLAGFVLSIVGFFFFNSYATIALFSALLFEAAITYYFLQMRSTSIGNISNFANDIFHRSSRYLLFKNSIKDQKIESSKIQNYLEFLQSQIELEAIGSINSKRVGVIGIPLIVAIPAGVFTKIDEPAALALALTLALLTFFLIDALASIFRTKEEKLRELKAFMTLYLNEVTSEKMIVQRHRSR